MEYTVFRTQKGFRVMGKISQDLDLFRMPVTLRVETEGNPEEKTVEVVGTSSEFVVETFGKPKNVVLDPKGLVLRFSTNARVAVAIRKGEQFVEVGEYGEALKEYQKALDVARNSSLAHFRIGQVHFLEGNWSPAANEFPRSPQRGSGTQVDRSVVPYQLGQNLRRKRSTRSRAQRIPSSRPYQRQHARRAR